jgi:hypothetical protein
MQEFVEKLGDCDFDAEKRERAPIGGLKDSSALVGVSVR